MKKLIISLVVALGLWGLTTTRAQAQYKQIEEVFPWHIDTYEVTSTEGTFTDISTASGVVALTTTEAQLLKVLFHATSETDATPTATKTAAFSPADDFTMSGFPLGFEFNLCGYKMTHFVVSATGGVYFNDSSMQGTYTSSPTAAGRWAVWTIPYVAKTANASTTMATGAGQIVQAEGKTPAYYLIEGTEGNHVLTVQYDFMVGATATTADRDEWIFQLKFYEATGKIDFIVKQLTANNALTTSAGKYHRILLNVMDFGAASPVYKQPNSTTNLFVDPYASTQMRIVAKGSNHKIFVGQTNAMYEDDGWNSFTLDGTLSETSTMRVEANGPSEGRTISFTPQSAPETADITPFTADYYSLSNEAITASSYSADILYSAAKFPTATAFHEAGPIVAVISTSETPDYTLENGTYYTAGHEFAEANGFKPRVIANQAPNITATWTKDTWTYPSRNFAVNLSASGLQKGQPYYIHLYRLAFAGTDAPAYSALCHTISFMTSFNDPKTFETVGLADIDGVTLKAEPAEGLSVLVVKSKTPNVKPSGLLKVGDKIGDAEVIELLSEAKEWKLPLENGEGCFIVAFSVNTNDADNYIYSPTKRYIAVGTAYDGLPGVVDFTTLSYGVPNWEYNGINIRSEEFKDLEPNTYRDLPFGYTRTEVAGNKSRDFGLGQPSYSARAPHFVYAKLGSEMDFITPPIVADQNRIMVTFNAQWLTSDDGGDVITATVGGETDNAKYCDIEYAIGDGEWQKGASFQGFELPERENGYFPVSFSLIAEEGQSFIGQKIRFRFKSTSEASGWVGIGSIDIKEDKICQTAKAIVINDALTTNTDLSFSWTDPNEDDLSPAESFEIAYKPADDETANWTTRKAETASYTLSGLKTNTAYTIQITADCGTWGKAYTSSPATLSTIRLFPYMETMKQDPKRPVLVGKDTVMVNGDTPFERGVSAMMGGLHEEGVANLNPVSGTPLSWSPTYCTAKNINNEGISNAVGIRETSKKDTGWMLMPFVFVPNTGFNFPQVIRFKATSASQLSEADPWEVGTVGEKYKDAKLFILLSHDGTFSMDDTIATIAVGTETINEREFEFEIPEALLQEGRAQVAFHFKNPAGTDAESNETLMLFEIFDFEYTYADGVCLPISNLERFDITTDGATLTWEGSSISYKISWGLRSEEGYSNSASTTETTYTLGNLQDNTQYKVMVEGFCNEEETEKSPTVLTTWFITKERCVAPNDFAVSDITTSGATFSSTSTSGIMTQRLVYITAQNDTATQIFAQTTDELAVTGLLDKTVYIAKTQSVCDLDSSEMSEPITFTTLADSFLIMLNVLPDDNAGTVTGAGRYEKGQEAKISAAPAANYDFVAWLKGNDTLSKEAIYTFNVTAGGTYTALFTESTANENLVKTAFNVSTKAGHLHIQNLQGLTVEEVTVYGLTGRQIGRFTPNSREDLVLPVNAERAVLVVRVASEQGAATYKVYLH